MNPTHDFLLDANKLIRITLDKIRPKLLEAQGNIEHSLKADESVVTEMDTYVESELKSVLLTLDSGIGFGGEEGGVDYSQKSFWLVDPIDGTDPFIRGIPIATNMITLIDNNEPILGIIYNFTLGDYYMAIKGKGATRNGHPIHVSNRPAEKAWITLTASNGRPGVLGLRDGLSKEVSRVRTIGSAGFHYSLMSYGATEGHVQYNGHGHEWDFAPGLLLIQEAGGRVANIGSDSYNYRVFNHVAANPVIFDKLMDYMIKVEKNAETSTN